MTSVDNKKLINKTITNKKQPESKPEPEPDMMDSNEIKVDIIATSIFNKTRQIFETTFNEIYGILLDKIGKDYEISVSELKTKYPMKVKIHQRKIKDPAMLCIGTKKSGDACGFVKKGDSDYCGVHLKQQHQDNPYSERSKITTTESRKPGKQKIQGNYVPKNEIKREEEKKEINFKRRQLTKSSDENEEIIDINDDNNEDKKHNEDKKNNEENSKEEDSKEEDSKEDKETTENDENISVSGSEGSSIDVEKENIEGVEYIVYDGTIYYIPENLEDVGFSDLKVAGVKNDDGSVKWVNKGKKKNKTK